MIICKSGIYDRRIFQSILWAIEVFIRNNEYGRIISRRDGTVGNRRTADKTAIKIKRHLNGTARPLNRDMLRHNMNLVSYIPMDWEYR